MILVKVAFTHLVETSGVGADLEKATAMDSLNSSPNQSSHFYIPNEKQELVSARESLAG